MKILIYVKSLFEKIISPFKEKLYFLRDTVAVHPRVMMWRLRLFNIFPPLSNHFFKIAALLIIIFAFFISFYIFAWRAPRPFPEHAIITVDRGENFSTIANLFEKTNIVRSQKWLKFFIRITGGDRRIVAGDYYFPKPVNIFKIVRILHKGEFGFIAEKITLHEGLSSFEMADLLSEKLLSFNKEEFLQEVRDQKLEGTLFPDTYFFSPNIKAPEVILSMRENFARSIKIYGEDILKSGRTLEEIIIMASIIENEANQNIGAKRLVSGILWRRLRLEMPLQVDAPFRYYNGKHSYTLTKEDLKEEHPYNTYVNKGLPPTAISNPGIDSIRAAIAPTNTDYLYFMSDKQGNMYYARDFAGHQRNREAYLR
ncbi:MAG: endolytic transglycosylase MltG [Patescibacteria group bacterium]